MMTILSVLVFILAQGCAVQCDEVYPISVLRYITQNQLEESSENNDNIQEIQEKRAYGRKKIKNVEDIKNEIAVYYKFKKHPTKDEWISQPDFKAYLGKSYFADDANDVEVFFLKLNIRNNWEDIKKQFSHINLLYITAARYLLVTHVLYELSGRRLIPCKSTPNKKYVIPASGVCFPAPYGSASYSSDYDVGLMGEDSGFLTKSFNDYFQKRFRKPSELVFDTNVYAFTLEYAMPFLFVGLPFNFATDVAENEQTIDFKMQELASAYYKVFKYNPGFFKTMTKDAKGAMDPVKASQSWKELDEWLRAFASLNVKVKMRIKYFYSPKDLRETHNIVYQGIVQRISREGGYKAKLLGNLATALIYAAEAYHTRGAIRHIVGGRTQMNVIDVNALSTNDLWVSMIENWGESNKEYNHCNNKPLEECFLKMSKYMWRMFNAMRLLRERLPPANRVGLVHFGEKFADPEFAFKMWLDYKKQGMNAIPKHRGNVQEFLRQFHCDNAANQVGLGRAFPLACLSKMNDKVNAYNIRMARLVTDKPVRPAWRP